MSLHEDLITELRKLYPNVSRLELDKIIDSEFRLISNMISKRDNKVVNCVGLGKFYPTTYKLKMDEHKKLKDNGLN